MIESVWVVDWDERAAALPSFEMAKQYVEWVATEYGTTVYWSRALTEEMSFREYNNNNNNLSKKFYTYRYDYLGKETEPAQVWALDFEPYSAAFSSKEELIEYFRKIERDGYKISYWQEGDYISIDADRNGRHNIAYACRYPYKKVKDKIFWVVLNADGTYAGSPCYSREEADELVKQDSDRVAYKVESKQVV